MSDITKCKGTDCLIKDYCYRFNVKPHPNRQSYFSDSPCETIDNKFTCDYYWGDNPEQLYKTLKDICK